MGAVKFKFQFIPMSAALLVASACNASDNVHGQQIVSVFEQTLKDKSSELLKSDDQIGSDDALLSGAGRSANEHACTRNTQAEYKSANIAVSYPQGPVSSRFSQAIERRKRQLLYIPMSGVDAPEVIEAYHHNVREIYRQISDQNLYHGFNLNPVYKSVTSSSAQEAIDARRLWKLENPRNPAVSAGRLDDSVEARLQLTNLMALIQAYQMPVPDNALPAGSIKFYQNPDVAKRIKIALDYITTHLYSKNSSAGSNWYQTEIGNQRLLINILYLLLGDGEYLYKNVSPDDAQKYIDILTYWSSSPTHRRNGTVETGANLADKAHTHLLVGLLQGDDAKVSLAARILSSHVSSSDISQPLLSINSLSTSKNGDGFYEDGGFIQHTNYSYLGNYGKDLFYDVATAADILADTKFDMVGSGGIKNFISIIEKTIDGQIYKGGLTRTSYGRSISRQDWTSHVRARWLAASVAIFIEALERSANKTEENHRDIERLRSLVKKWIGETRAFNAPNANSPAASYLAGIIDPITQNTFSTDAAKRLWSIWSNPCVNTDKTVTQINHMPSIARVFAKNEGRYSFGLDISMFSKWIYAFTSLNNQNAQGWWRSMGTLYLHTADQAQFNTDYEPTVDLKRLPGTTTDRSGNYNVSDASAVNAGATANTSEFVGASILSSDVANGVSSVMMGTIGMSFSTANVTAPASGPHNRLSANKSWFLFGDKVIALGSYIRGGNSSVETIVENRRLSTKDATPVVSFGKGEAFGELNFSIGSKTALNNAEWLHFQDPLIPNSPIGYVFLEEQPKIDTLLENRTGTWNALDKGQTTYGDVVVKENRYFSIAYQHGHNLTETNSGAYSYVILPGRSKAELAAENLRIRENLHILRNDRSASAVFDADLGLTGINIWSRTDAQTGSQSEVIVKKGNAPLIKARGLMSVTMHEPGDGSLKVAVSEPTRSYNEVKLSLNIGAECLVVTNKDIKVTFDTGGIANLTVNSVDKSGLSKELVFKLREQGNATRGTFEADSASALKCVN